MQKILIYSSIDKIIFVVATQLHYDMMYFKSEDICIDVTCKLKLTLL